jgi:two-component system, chemotaxis family, sensor kinase CheA
MDADFTDLVPLFVGETRGRLERLAALAARVETDPQAAAEARRELHTVKGAGRMLGLQALAELCHRAEGTLQTPAPGAEAALIRTVDEISLLVDTVASSSEPAGAGDVAPAAPGAGAPAGETHPNRKAAPAVGAAEVRLDVAALDGLADRAIRQRILATGAVHYVNRIAELARLAEEGASQPHPEQVLHGLATALRSLSADIDEGQRRLRRIAERQVDALQALQVQPLRPFLQSLARHARELARSLGRELEVRIAGDETRLDRGIAADLEEALLHLVRNAVDHGVEPAADRVARGKPAAGTLRIEAAARGARVRLVIADDGGGIDAAAVVAAAAEAGLVDPARAAAMTSDEAYRLVFTPGFSTRREVTEVSGRGIGLDAVAAAVARLGGDVALASTPGAGTTVTVEVPAARRGDDVILARVGHVRLGLPAGTVRRVSQLAQADVIERGGHSLARVGDRLVEFVPLAALCGETPAARGLLLEGVVAGQPMAVAVDALEGQEEVLVRPLTRTVPTDVLIEGVALLTSGEPVGILSPLALTQRAALRPAPGAAVLRAPARLRVLLVDDSLVTREMERRLLEDAGFVVTVAADASEALAHLGADRYDCVVTDIEMPGMDGFELTRHLRSVPQFAQLPVVVVSTRERPEDRLRGLEAGADAYLTKQGLRPAELVGLVNRLGVRR